MTASAGDEDSDTTSSGVTTSSDGDEAETRGEEEDSSSSSSTGACEPGGPGQWANCEMGESCGGDSTCLELDPAIGACSFTCTSACDCPAAPASGDAVVTCGDHGFGQGCFLSCQGGEACPNEMVCTVGLCAYNNVVVVPDYEACNTPGWDCSPGSECIGGEPLSSCLPQGCNNASECPVPPDGMAQCGDAGSGGPNDCYIDCGGELDCPLGWECVNGYLCLQSNP
ncbi:MAG: hypothetical protein JKY37_20475 [Nannocystaceae bacterium]|nr:hypothetical protein [Nannocystaceae bacterium]